MNKLKIAILGSGNIGTDLLMKVLRSSLLECNLFIGHNFSSRGMSKAISLGVPVSNQSINAIIANPDCCDIVFDATSAIDHIRHSEVLDKLGKMVIDLTPSNLGKMCIPVINLNECLGVKNVNVVTCGGQASTPLAYVIGQLHDDIEYIESVSTIASRSAGPATRRNIDEYVSTTERAIQQFSGCKKQKAILILNPAQPDINMKTTVFAKVREPEIEILTEQVNIMVEQVKRYVPGYQLIVPPTLEGGRIIISVKVEGLGDYLPSFAGNLDIINCAAVAIAEEYAKTALE